MKRNRFQVTYTKRALDQTAALLMTVRSKRAFTDAINASDAMLAEKADKIGESRGGATRVFILGALVQHYDCHPDDCRVQVLDVRWVEDV